MFVSRKIAVFAFFAICSITFIQCNVFDDILNTGASAAKDVTYQVIGEYLDVLYKDNLKKAECMIDDFKRNKIVDELFSTDLVANPYNILSKIQPYIDAATLKCEVLSFLLSPLGIGIMVVIACVLAFSIIFGLIRCMCR